MIIIGSPGSHVFAQDKNCDEQLKAADGLYGYIPRQNRCEGLYDFLKVSETGELRLVSLTKGPIQYKLKPGLHIILKAASEGLEPSTLHVRAITRESGIHYQMDARLSTGESLYWPADDVLLPIFMTADRIGIFAWTLPPKEEIFVPLRVNQPASDDVFMLVQPTMNVHDVMWRYSYSTADRKTVIKWNDVAVQASSGEIIPIVMSDAQSGLLSIEVAAMDENGKWIKLRLKVWNE